MAYTQRCIQGQHIYTDVISQSQESVTAHLCNYQAKYSIALSKNK